MINLLLRKGDTYVKEEYVKKSKPNDIVFNNLDLKGLTLDKLYINTTVTNNSITIPSEVIENLNLSTGTNYLATHFSNGYVLSGVLGINIVDNSVDDTPIPDTKPEDKPSEDNKPDNDSKPDEDAPIIKYPGMNYQNPKYDLNNPNEITITDVNFNGTTLKSIIINSRILDSNYFSTTDTSIIIPSSTLQALHLVEGNYQVTYIFSNGVSMAAYSDITAFRSKNTIIKEPIKVSIDENKNEDIEIPNLIPEGKKVASITINNVVLNVIYRNEQFARIALLNISPVVYIDGSKLIIPTDTLKYINSTSDSYNININLNDNSTISQQFVLSAKPVDNDNNIADNNNSSNDNSTAGVNNSSSSDNASDNNSISNEDTTNSNIIKPIASSTEKEKITKYKKRSQPPLFFIFSAIINYST